MVRHIETGVKDILEDPDPTKSARLVLVAENADPQEVEERAKAAEGEVIQKLPGGVYTAEIPENRIDTICEGDLIDSISLDDRLQLA